MAENKKINEYIGKNTNELLKNCFKLTNIDKYWEEIVGPLISEKTQISECEITKEGQTKITINVQDNTLLQAIKFRKAKITQALRKYFRKHELTVEIKQGKIERKSTAKPPQPDYKRRAPVILDKEKITEETKEFAKQIQDTELAETMAKIKLSIEKINARNK
ncbi:MAG: DciA family protein [Synergistaceae bacterium]